jgi:hypothetical protein
LPRGIRLWIGIAISLAFLLWLFMGTDLGRVGQALRAVDYSWFAVGLPIYFLGVWLRAVRWRQLLAPIKMIPSRALFPYIVLGFMANNVLPLRVGELVRAYFLGEKAGISKTSTLATILVERVLDALTLLFFVTAVSLFLPLPDWLRAMMVVAGFFFLSLLALSFIAAFLPGPALTVIRLLVRLLPSAWRPRAEQMARLFLEGFASLSQGRRLGMVALLSLLVWLAETGLFFFVGFAFRLILPLPAFLLATAAANLGISVPSSQGGIGPFEFLAARALGLFQVEPSLAAAYAIVVHAAVLLPITLLGFFYLWREDLSLGRLWRRPVASVEDGAGSS